MEKNNLFNTDFYSKALVVSDKNLLAEKLVERLLEKKFKITISCKNESTRYAITEHMKGVNFLPDLPDFTQKYAVSYDYIIFIKTTFGNQFNIQIKKTIRLLKSSGAKTFFVFPYSENPKNYDRTKKNIKKIYQEDFSAGIVFVGDLVLKDFDVNDLDNLSNEREKFISFLNAKQDSLLFPVYLQDSVDQIEKMLFSLGAYGKKTAIVSHPATQEKVKDLISVKETIADRDSSNNGVFLRHGVDEVVSSKAVDDDDLAFFLKSLLGEEEGLVLETPSNKFEDNEVDLSTHKVFAEADNPPVTLSKDNKVKTKLDSFFLGFKQNLIKNKYKISLSLVGFLLLFPFLILLLNLLLLKGIVVASTTSGQEMNPVFFGASEKISKINVTYSGFLASAPVLGAPYNTTKNISVLLMDYAEIEKINRELLQTTTEVVEGLFKGEPTEINVNAQKLTLGLESLYNKSSFLQGEVNDADDVARNVFRKIVSEQELVERKNQAFYLKEIAIQMPVILGQDEPKMYLIILQDDQVLRSTGGLIRELALVNISGGRLVKAEVFSTAELNNEIQGEASVPEPFSKYFKEEEWSFKNANWDPDFPKTAERLEWFIDKSLNRSVDGVLSVNLSLVEQLSETTERKPTKELEELFNTSKPAKEDQNYILENFIYSLYSADSKNRLKALSVLKEGVADLNLQVFLNNNQAQRAIDDLGWTNTVQKQVCSQENCYSDFVYLVGVEKEGHSNPEILKQAELKVAAEEGVVKRELVFYIENKEAGLNKNTHEMYLRVFVPGESGFAPVEIVTDSGRQQTEPDIYGSRGFKEAGVLTEIEPGSAKAYIFKWESPLEVKLEEKGKYYLFWKKQPGEKTYQTMVDFDFSKDVTISSNNELSLTDEQALLYNTPLSEDLLFQAIW